VLEALRRAPRRSRAELASETGLSKPTVSSALRSLSGIGLVRERGRSMGRRGPSASLYEPVPEAALVVGIDIGVHHVRAVVADLDGVPRAEAEQAVGGPDASHILEAVHAAHVQVGGAEAELAVVGSPGVVDPATGRIRSAPNITSWEGVQVEAALGDALGLGVVVENDVNLAALGELAAGAGRGRRSFAYLKVGSGLGAGLVLDGRLFRGHHGAAGEVGYLAVGGDPLGEADPARGAMERRLSQEAVTSAARAVDAADDRDPRSLFAAARRGDPVGRAAVTSTAQALAVCIASMTAVLDLELVLLGGGIGIQTDLLLEPARVATRALVPFAPEIAPGALGDRATLLGAVAVGADTARTQLISRSIATARAVA